MLTSKLAGNMHIAVNYGPVKHESRHDQYAARWVWCLIGSSTGCDWTRSQISLLGLWRSCKMVCMKYAWMSSQCVYWGQRWIWVVACKASYNVWAGNTARYDYLHIILPFTNRLLKYDCWCGCGCWCSSLIPTSHLDETSLHQNNFPATFGG